MLKGEEVVDADPLKVQDARNKSFPYKTVPNRWRLPQKQALTAPPDPRLTTAMQAFLWAQIENGRGRLLQYAAVPDRAFK